MSLGFLRGPSSCLLLCSPSAEMGVKGTLLSLLKGMARCHQPRSTDESSSTSPRRPCRGNKAQGFGVIAQERSGTYMGKTLGRCRDVGCSKATVMTFLVAVLVMVGLGTAICD